MSVTLEIKQPKSLPEALAILATGHRQQRPWVPLAVGDDLQQWCQQNGLLVERVLDISRLPGLHGISESEREIHVGALTSFETLRRSSLVERFAPALKSASIWSCSSLGPVLPTLGGSLVDGLPSQLVATVLAALDVELTVVGEPGLRLLPLCALFGPDAPGIYPDELLLRVSLPKPSQGGHQRFIRVGAYEAGELATLALAIDLSTDHARRLTRLTVALGEIAEPPHVLSLLEQLEPNASVESQAVAVEQILCQRLARDVTLSARQRALLPRLGFLTRRAVARHLKASPPAVVMD